MTRRRVPPTFMPGMPCSQPRITRCPPERKRERLAAVARTVELAAALVLRGRVVEPAGVVDDDDHARQRLVADAVDEVGDEHRGLRAAARRGGPACFAGCWRAAAWRCAGARAAASGNACERAPDQSAERLWCHGVKIAVKVSEGTVPFDEGFPESAMAYAEGDSPPRGFDQRLRVRARGRAGGGRRLTKSSSSSNSWAMRSTAGLSGRRNGASGWRRSGPAARGRRRKRRAPSRPRSCSSSTSSARARSRRGGSRKSGAAGAAPGPARRARGLGRRDLDVAHGMET